MAKNKFTIITPCFNAERFIEDTVLSIFNNTAVMNEEIDLEYIVCDGASTDQTIKIIDKIFNQLKYSHIRLELKSEKDSGIYSALAKGLQIASGDYVAYLNAGDLYAPHAFEIVNTVFNSLPVKWITGLTVIHNEFNHMIGVWLPFKYRRNLIQCGFYDGRLPFIQQETTFWKRDLLAFIDFQKLASLQYAGDFYLWKQFSEQTDLFIVEAWLGGWKIHRGQISADLQTYVKEMHSITNTPVLFDYLLYFYDFFSFYLPSGLKKRLNRKTIIRFDLDELRYTI